MRLLLLTDRLDSRGGALGYWLDLLGALALGHEVRVAVGHGSPGRLGALWPEGVAATRVRALMAPDEDDRDLAGLEPLLAWADRVHVQNVMNPLALARIVATGKAVITVQDHRVFCPGPGRTLPDGRRCDAPFEATDCAACLPEPEYRRRMIRLTAARRDALRGARLTALSRYMADELARAGLPGAEVLPPWVEVGPPRTQPGEGAILAGRLVAHKGVDLGLEAFRRSGIPGPLRVAGAGAFRSMFDDSTSIQWRDRADLLHQMRDSRALLFPARWQEPFGIVGLEALSVGVPVIAMDTGGVGDWAGEGVLRVPAGDVGAMADALRALHEAPEAALALGEAGRQRVARDFAPAPLRARWEALIAA